MASTSPATVTTPLDNVIKSVSPVCPITAPSITTLSTVSADNVPRLVILVCAAVFNVPANSVVVKRPLEGLYVNPVSVSAP